MIKTYDNNKSVLYNVTGKDKRMTPNIFVRVFLSFQLEDYLLKNQEVYFEYSSRNYSAEQRKYNNDLTRGLLELASSEGYVFENFIFSMVRDRIRCYYKSHSQSAKKRKR